MEKEKITKPEIPTANQFYAELKRVRYKKNFRKTIIATVNSLIVVAAISVLISLLFLPVLRVTGTSMTPTLYNDELVICNKRSNYKQGDMIAFYFNNKILLKRVIGLPGENIEYRNNTLYIDGQEVETKYNFDTDDFTLTSICNCDKIPEDKYLVLGDNRKVSADSRIIGLIDKKDIEGSAHISILPIKKVK